MPTSRIASEDLARSLFSACHQCENIPSQDAHPSAGDDTSKARSIHITRCKGGKDCTKTKCDMPKCERVDKKN